MVGNILAESSLGLRAIDFIVLIGYLVGIVAIGCWAGIRSRRGVEGKKYFLAGGTLTWPIIGLALFSTNISAIHIVGFAQEGFNNGLVAGNWEWMAIITLILLSLFFAPFYIRSGIVTLPDFLEKRYNRACRDWLTVISIVSAIIIHIGFTLYTSALVLKSLFGIPIMASIIGVAVLTGIYTIVGGLLAVVVTESIQTIVLLIGSMIITIVAFVKVGGWSGLQASVEPVKLTMLRPSDDPSGFPWYGFFLGYWVTGVWYWCADQTIVQRVLGAKDENHARIGPLFTGFIKILPTFIFVLPGIMCFALIKQGKLPDTLTAANSKETYSFLITHLLPPGLTGIMAAALLAAVMSTVSGALNSIATLFSYDLFKRWKPDVSDKSLVIIGRVVTGVAVIAAICWSPFIEHFQGIYKGCVDLICYIAPPITAVFLLGVLWKRASSTGALVTLIGGSFLGLIVFLLDWFSNKTGWNIPALMSAFYLVIVCMITLVTVSLIKPHHHTEKSSKLVWGHPMDALRGKAWKGIGNYKFVAALLFITFVVFYLIFG